jgi:hypothetical protein
MNISGNVSREMSKVTVEKVNQRMVAEVGPLMGNEGIIYSQDKERNFTNGVMKANKKIDLIL